MPSPAQAPPRSWHPLSSSCRPWKSCQAAFNEEHTVLAPPLTCQSPIPLNKLHGILSSLVNFHQAETTWLVAPIAGSNPTTNRSKSSFLSFSTSLPLPPSTGTKGDMPVEIHSASSIHVKTLNYHIQKNAIHASRSCRCWDFSLTTPMSVDVLTF
jgi:hypothetical protein